MDYFSVKTENEVEKVIERSRFITFVCPCENEEEARAILEKRRKLHKTATHNCYAYVTNLGGYSRFSDDGEPSGTAGAPIMEAIKTSNITNAIVVVTRYFGGIKLGAGGLTRAYLNCAVEAIKKSQVVKFVECYKSKLTLQYDDYQAFLRFTKGKNVIVENITYSDQIDLSVFIPLSDFEQFNSDFLNAFCGKYNLTAEEKIYKTFENL